MARNRPVGASDGRSDLWPSSRVSTCDPALIYRTMFKFAASNVRLSSLWKLPRNNGGGTKLHVLHEASRSSMWKQPIGELQLLRLRMGCFLFGALRPRPSRDMAQKCSYVMLCYVTTPTWITWSCKEFFLVPLIATTFTAPNQLQTTPAVAPMLQHRGQLAASGDKMWQTSQCYTPHCSRVAEVARLVRLLLAPGHVS